MKENQPPQLWNDSRSIYDIPLAPRPILDEISIVIPTLGRDILQQSIYWILTGSAWPACLIVVNQGPAEKVEGWLQYMRANGVNTKHIQSRQRGRSAGINRGLEQVESKFVAITDDDCFVDSDWLLNMSVHLREHPESIVTGRVEAAGDDMVLIVTSTTPAVYNRPRIKFDSMSGGNMGTSINVVERIGLFDEDPCMQTAEDAEWSYRALRAGTQIIFTPDVCVWHFGWRDPAKRAEQYRSYALSHGGFYGKYLRKGDAFIFLRAAVHYARSLRRWIYGVVTGNTDLALLGRAYFTGLLPGIYAGLRSRALPGKLS